MTNAQSRFINANDRLIMKEAVLKIHDFCEENYKFNIVSSFSNESKDDKVVLLGNDDYCLLIKRGVERHSVRGSDGTIRTYIYDEKDGIYKTKFKTHILAPHFHMAYEMYRCGFQINWEQYWKNYSGKGDVFEEQSSKIRQRLHTGNHHRNKFNRVPQSVYGMR